MKRKNKKLARLVLGALLTSGAMLAPSAEAAEVTYDGTTMNPAGAVSGDTLQFYINPTNVTAGYKTLTLNGPGNGKYLSAGYSNATTTNLSGFTINVNGGNWASIYGAQSANSHSTGTLSDNTVNINIGAGNISSVKGGISESTDTVTGNIVNIKDGKIGYKMDGTVGEGNAVDGGFSRGKVTQNQVNIEGGTVNAYVYGGRSGYIDEGQDVANNTVTITGGNITGNIYGGFVAGAGNATKNTVTISGGTINGTVIGGQSGNGAATGNTVNIDGSTVKITGNVQGAVTGGDATGNTVNIYAVEDITGGIYAGMSTGGTSSGNVINILGTINISGYLDGDGTQTINIASKDNAVDHLLNYGGIKNMNFYLPSDIKNGDTMLTIKNVDPWEGKTTDLKGVTFGVAAQSGVSLSKGNTVTLVTNPNGLTTDSTLSTDTVANVTAKAPTGITTSKEYEFEIAKSGTNSLIATVTGATENNESSESAQEYAKSPVETRAATTTFVNAGADMLASQGFAQAANAVALDTAAQAQSGAAGAPAASAFTPFAAFGGQSMRAQSGSYVDTKGFGLNIGFARELPNSQGKLLFGPVVEYGGGTYASHLENAEGTRGDGKAHYFGVGIMARQVNHDGLYYEGSVRGGRVTSDYRSFINTQTVDYDSSSNYWAAHVGVGKAFSVGGSNTLDGYLKYFYSHQAGDDVTMHGSTSGDEAWSFDAVDSHRIRIGARLTHKVNERNSFYGGLAYQYEFGGEARAHYNGTATPSPSVKGSSGMLELGWQVKPGGPVTLDLGVTGWAGKQRGGSVQLGATWSF